MNEAKPVRSHTFWANQQALTHVDRLEAACHQVILHPGDEPAREVLRAVLHLDVGAGVDPASPAAGLVKVAAAQIFRIAEIMSDEFPDDLPLRVATAHLCQTLTGLRSHLDDGPRTVSFGPRRER